MTRIRIHWSSNDPPSDHVIDIEEATLLRGLADVLMHNGKPGWLMLEHLFIHTAAISGIEIVAAYQKED